MSHFLANLRNIFYSQKFLSTKIKLISLWLYYWYREFLKMPDFKGGRVSNCGCGV